MMRRTPLRRGKPLSRSKRLRYRRPVDPRWESARAAVFERDGYTCQFPGLTGHPIHSGRLEPHHRSLRGAGGTSDEGREYGLANLVSLCRHPHRLIHCMKRKEAERLGFIVPRFPGDDPESIPVLTIHGLVYLLPGGSRVAADGEADQ